MLRVLIADDHLVVRRGVKQIFEEASLDATFYEAGDGREIMGLVRENECDMVILDLNLPGRHGLDVLKDLHHEKPTLPVLVLSMHEESQYAVRALKAGASGYLMKDSAFDELANAIRQVLDGKRYITLSLATQLADSFSDDTFGLPHDKLSDREFQVFCGIASGKSLTEIGKDLGLSIKTVSTYRGRILEKMSMKSNSEVTKYAILNHLVT